MGGADKRELLSLVSRKIALEEEFDQPLLENEPKYGKLMRRIAIIANFFSPLPGAGRARPAEIHMGHRALIAYERPDGLYNCHYSHWGRLHLRLKHEITPKTPFGGPDTDCTWAKDLFTQLIEDAPGPDLEGYDDGEKPTRTTVDHIPRAKGLTLEEIITEQLDFLHHEAFYVVDSDFEVTAYRTLWFGLHYDAESVEDGPTIGNGALRTVRWYDGEPVGGGYVQGEFQGLKKTVADLIDRGVFFEEEAIEYMKGKLCEWVGDREQLIIRTPELGV